MVKIDSDLLDRLKLPGNRPVPAIIICQSECESVVKALKQTGIRITSTGSLVFGCIAAEITADQLDAVRSIPGITSIEYDQEAKALD